MGCVRAGGNIELFERYLPAYAGDGRGEMKRKQAQGFDQAIAELAKQADQDTWEARTTVSWRVNHVPKGFRWALTREVPSKEFHPQCQGKFPNISSGVTLEECKRVATGPNDSIFKVTTIVERVK